jgi:small-conductance mechanosensitive channel
MLQILQQAIDTSGILEVMAYSFGNNTIGVYSLSLVLFALLWAIIRAFRLVGLRRLRRWAATTSSTFDDKILQWAAEISPFFFASLSAVIIVNLYLVLPVDVELILAKGFVIVTIYEAMRLIQKAINYGLTQTPLNKNTTTLHGIQRIFGVAVWSVGLLMVLSNLGVNVTTLVASLGIGGIAIAFAIQHILGDIFSSFSIFFDKPFAEGDYVVVGSEEGEILQIGLKTTRITALGGEEIVMSNKELTESCIHNYGKLQRRRVSFMTNIAFDTPLKKLRMVDDILQKAVKAQKICEFDRVWFKKINDWSYDFETVYYVLSDEYIDYACAQEDINWFLLENLEKAGIELALPTSVKISYTK